MKHCKVDCVPTARRDFWGLFKLPKFIVDSTDISSFMHRYHKLEKGDLQIAMTGLPFLSKRRIQEFTSEDDLLQCLLSSCAIFPFAGLVHYRGMWNMDGGVTDFVPEVYGEGITPENTVSVSPFYFSSCDIKPSRYIPFWWAIIPPNNSYIIDWIYALGYEDGINYIDSKVSPDMLPPVQRPKIEGNHPRRMITRSQSGRIRADVDDIVENGNVIDVHALECKRGTHKLHRCTQSFDPVNMRCLSTKGTPYYSYSERRSMSIHRFFGYRFLPYQWLEMSFDAVLYVLVVCVWKPLILSIIYAELIAHVIVLAMATIARSLSDFFSPIMIAVGATLLSPHYAYLVGVACYVVVQKIIASWPKSKAYDRIWKCVCCIGSLSLLFRFVSGAPSPTLVKKHDMLEEVSLSYRFFKYVI